MSKVYYKSAEQIEGIRESALLVSKTLSEVAKVIDVGVKTITLDRLAETFIRDHGGIPAFLNHPGVLSSFPNSLCISLNDQVVHGLPGDYELKDGDIVSVDCGTILNGFYGDSAYTFPVGRVSEDILKLLKVTKECLDLGIEAAVVGMRVGDIGYAIQQHAQKMGYGVVRELVGHGVGVELHEKPEIPNYGKRGSGMKLEEGMVIAIEPMINAGKAAVKFWNDGWTVSTVDGKCSAHFEHTVSVQKGKADKLSTFSYIEKVLRCN
jgi:methionyl aminopeptidase